MIRLRTYNWEAREGDPAMEKARTSRGRTRVDLSMIHVDLTVRNGDVAMINGDSTVRNSD